MRLQIVSDRKARRISVFKHGEKPKASGRGKQEINQRDRERKEKTEKLPIFEDIYVQLVSLINRRH